jgi:geranylgeranyl pyrophosphate synthase
VWGGKHIKDFKAFTAEYRDVVYGKIMEYLAIDAPEDFQKIMRSYTERKGQYRRPMYTILWNMLYGGNVNDAILPAAAQQLSEDYVLMHDDWMDGNSFRRGLPAAHVLYGAVYAINAGDTLHTILWKIAEDARKNLGEKRGERYLKKFQDIMLVTHIGQHLDLRLTRDTKDITKFTFEDYFRSIHAKSAYYSVYGPMQCGAIIAGADDATLEKIKEYGTPAGLAFQIKDDILDCSSTEAELGKSIGTDIREGVKTIILWHAVHNSDSATLNKMVEIYKKSKDAKTEDEIRFMIEKFKELGSIDFAEKEADKLVAKATAGFESASKDIPESEIKEIARSSIAHTTKRHK